MRGFLYFLLEKNLIQNRQLPTLNTNLSSENYWYFTKCIYYRIFRGYVARNVYKKLLRDERERLEDERKAAVEIQRYNLDCKKTEKNYCIHMDLREITFKFVAFYSDITGDTGVISSGKRRFISKQVLRRNTWSGHLISSK